MTSISISAPPQSIFCDRSPERSTALAGPPDRRDTVRVAEPDPARLRDRQRLLGALGDRLALSCASAGSDGCELATDDLEGVADRAAAKNSLPYAVQRTGDEGDDDRAGRRRLRPVSLRDR